MLVAGGPLIWLLRGVQASSRVGAWADNRSFDIRLRSDAKYSVNSFLTGYPHFLRLFRMPIELDLEND